MKEIIIAGNSITAEIVYQYLSQDSRYRVVAFAVDEEYVTGDQFCGLPQIGFKSLSTKFNPANVRLVMAIGYKNINKNRQNIFEKLKEEGFHFETYIHPDAKIFNGNKIGEGSLVLANTVVEPFSVIGKNCVVWANCTIGHHSKIEDHTWIASGTVIAGEGVVKNNTFLGVNVTVANQVTVEAFNVIGGSTFIAKDTKPNEVYLSRNGEKHRFDAENYMKYYIK